MKTAATEAQVPPREPPDAVEPVDTTRRTLAGVRAVVGVVGYVVVLAGLGVYHVWQRHDARRLGMDLSTETLRYRAAYEEHKKLKLELASVKRVDRLRDNAEARLGMRAPAPQHIVEIR